MKSETFIRIMQSVEHARGKYEWPKGYQDSEKFTALQSEINEMSAAMLKGNKRQKVNEAYDALAVLVRIIEGDGEDGV